MHSPDHLLTTAASVTTGVVAVGALGLAATRARSESLAPEAGDRRQRIGMAAAVTGLVFGAQMLNFPVGPGISGHLLGGALAAALLGPWLGLLSIAVVLLAQAAVFADGGLVALGTNVTLMGVVGVGVGWAVTSAVLARRPSRLGVPGAAALGGLLSVPASALVLAGLYGVAGTTAAPAGALVGQLVGWHALIGLGEAAITAVLVAAVMAANPSLVYAVRRFGVVSDARTRAAAGVLGIAATAAVLAGAASRLASPHPDGLEFVAQNLGIDVAAGAQSLAAPSWLAEYGAVAGLDVGLAGVIGVLLVSAVALGLTALVARRPADSPAIAGR